MKKIITLVLFLTVVLTPLVGQRTDSFDKIMRKALKIENDSLMLDFLSSQDETCCEYFGYITSFTAIQEVFNEYKDIYNQNVYNDSINPNSYMDEGYVVVPELDEEYAYTDSINYLIVPTSFFQKESKDSEYGYFIHLVEISYKKDGVINCLDLTLKSGFLRKELNTDNGIIKIEMYFNQVIIKNEKNEIIFQHYVDA